MILERFKDYIDSNKLEIHIDDLGIYVLNYKKIQTLELIFPIVFIGGFLFHLIWEAKCQYTITYFILLIPYAIVGYKIIGEKLLKLYNTKIKKLKYIE